MKRTRVAFIALAWSIPASVYAEACVEPESLYDSVAAIAKTYVDEDGDRALASGTAWFRSNRLLITNAHVAKALRLAHGAWQRAILQRVVHIDGRYKLRVYVREVRLVHSLKPHEDPEKDSALMRNDIAAIELRDEEKGVRPLGLSTRALRYAETFVVAGFPGREPVAGFATLVASDSAWGPAFSAQGWFLESGTPALFSKGASGSPVVDCSGIVIAMVNAVPRQGSPSARRAWAKSFPRGSRTLTNFAVPAGNIFWVLLPLEPQLSRFY